MTILSDRAPELIRALQLIDIRSIVARLRICTSECEDGQ